MGQVTLDTTDLSQMYADAFNEGYGKGYDEGYGAASEHRDFDDQLATASDNAFDEGYAACDEDTKGDLQQARAAEANQAKEKDFSTYVDDVIRLGSAGIVRGSE